MVAVEQQDRAGHGAGIHAHSFLCIHLDDHKASPVIAAAFHPWLQALQETLPECQYLLDMHAHNHRFRGCALRVDDHHVVEFIVAWREDRGALVDFGGIDKIQHREMLHVQNFIHTFRLSPRLQLRKLEMWACLKPVYSASRKPVRSPASIRSKRVLRRSS